LESVSDGIGKIEKFNKSIRVDQNVKPLLNASPVRPECDDGVRFIEKLRRRFAPNGPYKCAEFEKPRCSTANCHASFNWPLRFFL
jgi:hypothetical protein